jgi:hypothetical protein
MIQTKRISRGRLLSTRRTLIQQTRIRQSFERQLFTSLIRFFEENGRIARSEYSNGGVRLLNLDTRLGQILLPHYRSVITQMSGQFVFTKEETDFERLVRRFITTVAGIRITQISNTTRRIINRIILQAELDGLGVEPTATRIIEQTKPSFTRRRASLIARTETHSASSFANQAMAESFNLPMKKRWISTNDNRTRSHHRAMNGTTVDLDDDFIVPYKGVEYRMKHAGDPRGGPANIINCRCVILYLEPDDQLVED